MGLSPKKPKQGGRKRRRYSKRPVQPKLFRHRPVTGVGIIAEERHAEDGRNEGRREKCQSNKGDHLHRRAVRLSRLADLDRDARVVLRYGVVGQVNLVEQTLLV